MPKETKQERSTRGRKAKWTNLDIYSVGCTGKEAGNSDNAKRQPAYVCLQFLCVDNFSLHLLNYFPVLIRWRAIRLPEQSWRDVDARIRGILAGEKVTGETHA
jgi:hypothetical protein